MSRINFRFSSAFTLLELLVTLSLVFILTAWAVPSWRHQWQHWRMRTAVARWTSLLTWARTEAIVRRRIVSVCGSTRGQICDGNWAAYRLFHLGDVQHSLLWVEQPLAVGRWSFHGFHGQQAVRFLPTGETDNNGRFTYQASSGAKKVVLLARSGRVRRLIV